MGIPIPSENFRYIIIVYYYIEIELSIFKKGGYEMTFASQLISEYRNKIAIPEQGVVLEGKAISDRKYNISIIVEAKPYYNYGVIAYFKCYNHANESKATHCVRVCFKIPRYLDHNDPMGKKFWELSSKDIKILLEILQSPPSNKSGRDTTWDELIYQYAEAVGLLTEYQTATIYKNNIHDNIVPKDCPIPDYTKLMLYARTNDKDRFKWMDGKLIEVK